MEENKHYEKRYKNLRQKHRKLWLRILIAILVLIAIFLLGFNLGFQFGGGSGLMDAVVSEMTGTTDSDTDNLDTVPPESPVFNITTDSQIVIQQDQILYNDRLMTLDTLRDQLLLDQVAEILLVDQVAIIGTYTDVESLLIELNITYTETVHIGD